MIDDFSLELRVFRYKIWLLVNYGKLTSEITIMQFLRHLTAYSVLFTEFTENQRQERIGHHNKDISPRLSLQSVERPWGVNSTGTYRASDTIAASPCCELRIDAVRLPGSDPGRPYLLSVPRVVLLIAANRARIISPCRRKFAPKAHLRRAVLS